MTLDETAMRPGCSYFSLDFGVLSMPAAYRHLHPGKSGTRPLYLGPLQNLFYFVGFVVGCIHFPCEMEFIYLILSDLPPRFVSPAAF